MSISLFNTLTRQKEEFIPREAGKVRMYVCGPTVYDSCHLGHARHGVVWDTIRRYFEHAGFDVTYIVNITDIDDKIIDRANESGTSWREVTSKYIPEYISDMNSLGVRRPSIQPRATEHITEMIEAVKTLIEKGFAYEVEGSVYFEVSKFKTYGQLSGRDKLDKEENVSRVEGDTKKRAPEDFALWKASKPNEPSWETPWGDGRPGWHIECSVMSSKYLGAPFDIHGGGADLVFPHHENEVAQAEALTGEKFVNYWMHNGFITVRDEKMSKSLSNFVTLRDLIGRFTGGALRLFFLNAHYRSPIEYSPERVAESAKALDRIYNCLEAIDRREADSGAPDTELAEKVNEAYKNFITHMDDDFNTAGALGVIFELISSVNTALKTGGATLGVAASTIRKMMNVLGLPIERETTTGGKLEDDLIDILLQLRKTSRAAKQFETADAIRDSLGKLGLEIEDLSGGEARAVRRV